MKNIIYLLVLLLFISCGTLRIEQPDMVGKYNRLHKSKNFLTTRYSLTLNLDNTFHLSIKTQDTYGVCIGIWSMQNNYIYLKCEDKEGTIAAITSGYLNKREYKLEIVNKNRIKFDTALLKRKGNSLN